MSKTYRWYSAGIDAWHRNAKALSSDVGSNDGMNGTTSGVTLKDIVRAKNKWSVSKKDVNSRAIT